MRTATEPRTATRIRALIVDDEPLARERIRALLEREPDIEVVAECADGRDAVSAIQAHEPDLLFLDIQMPGLDGFGVVEEVGVDRMPVTIFVTAYDRYALKAFEANALDYLVKPFDRARFQRALRRARDHVQRSQPGELDERVLAMLEEAKSKRKPLDRIMIKASGRVFFLRTEEIDWIEAAGNYVKLHVGKDSHLLRETMNTLETKLESKQFIRIHRSTIVNIERIQELQPLFHGDYVVILRDGSQLTLSRSYRAKFQGFFGELA